MTSTTALRVAALIGFLAVALGAFGAHRLADLLQRHGRVATWETAALYHLVHAAVLVMISRGGAFPRVAWWLFTIGIIIFSGSLYILCITNQTWLGRITPLGGAALLG